jgi:hypothetical protein
MICFGVDSVELLSLLAIVLLAEKLYSRIRITTDSQNTTTICCSYLFVRVTTCFGPN